MKKITVFFMVMFCLIGFVSCPDKMGTTSAQEFNYVVIVVGDDSSKYDLEYTIIEEVGTKEIFEKKNLSKNYVNYFQYIHPAMTYKDKFIAKYFPIVKITSKTSTDIKVYILNNLFRQNKDGKCECEQSNAIKYLSEIEEESLTRYPNYEKFEDKAETIINDCLAEKVENKYFYSIIKPNETVVFDFNTIASEFENK